MRFKRWLFPLLALVLAVLCGFTGIVLSDMIVKLEKVDYYSEDLPPQFYGYRILCISDFHDAFYFDQVARMVNEEKPDVVLFLGDMTELAHSDWDNTLRLLEMIDCGAPVYGVMGNHEVLSPKTRTIAADLELHGMYLLNNEAVQLSRDGATISLIGLRDITDGDDALEDSWLLEQAHLYLETVIDPESFSLLAVHRATLYPYLKDLPGTLMLSGHLHGGVIRIPKAGGLIDVDGSWFPDYDKGFYSEGEMEMFVSSGCDFNLKKLRVFNRPCVTLLTLKR